MGTFYIGGHETLSGLVVNAVFLRTCKRVSRRRNPGRRISPSGSKFLWSGLPDFRHGYLLFFYR